MTNVELYDLALLKGISEPAVFRLGNVCIFGRWLNANEADRHDQKRIMPQSPTRVILVLAEGKEWEDCAVAMGWVESTTTVRRQALLHQNVPGPVKPSKG